MKLCRRGACAVRCEWKKRREVSVGMFVDLGMHKPTEPDDEQVSVILRRRVPINKNDNYRSWLGGLPQMPSEVKWPRDKERSPLHFVAQVCCSDLPDDLWGGIGP